MYLKKQHFIGVFKREIPFNPDDFHFRRLAAQCVTFSNPLNGRQYTVLWNTIIVKRHYTKVILNTGGWRTVTTKKRINEQLRTYCIQQKDFEWYVLTEGKEDVTIRLPFKENMTLID